MSATALPKDKSSIGRRLLYLGLAFAGISLIIIIGVVAIAIVVTMDSGLSSTVEVLRDLFAILLLIEALLFGAALTILTIQIAKLANMIHNEAMPIIASSSETINTVRGTATFISQHLTDPLIEINSVVAGAREAMRLVKDFKGLRDIIMKAASGSNGDNSSSKETAPK